MRHNRLVNVIGIVICNVADKSEYIRAYICVRADNTGVVRAGVYALNIVTADNAALI